MHIFSFIKYSYLGEITEVYKPYVKDLIYIDIISLYLYPYAALNLMPGTLCYWIESSEDKGLNLNELWVFVFAKVQTNKGYLGLLPLRINKNELIYPNGEFMGIWSSEELKFAKENGYEIVVIKGYNLNKK